MTNVISSEQSALSAKIDIGLADYKALLKISEDIGRLRDKALFGLKFSIVISMLNLWLEQDSLLFTSLFITTMLSLYFIYLIEVV